jgi:anthranilate phosphoribosyltransferase
MAPGRSWSEVLTGLVAGRDLAAEETAWAMEEILSGQATNAQIAGFAVALRAKGETVDELEGLVTSMYAHARTLDVSGRVVDIVGTGGDRARTVNISTMSAVVMAAAGARVIKHGGRAASSASGSADVLEALGVRLDVPVDAIAAVAESVGITFCFAPAFHASLRHAAGTRKELAIATTFNFLGPLTNPARPQAQAIGCADPRMAPIMAGVLARRGTDALVFRGDDGLDELTTTTTSSVWIVEGASGSVRQETVDPVELGLARSRPEDLRGDTPAYNADVFRRVLAGEPGPVLDAVLLNAAAGLAAHEGGTEELLPRLAAGVERARQAVASGAGATTLARWVEVSREHAPRA